MKNISKLFVGFLLYLLIFSAQTGLSFAGSTTIYETSSTQTITSGVTLTNIQRFTYDGWLNIGMLKVNLTNPHIKIDTAVNKTSLNSLSPVLEIAKENGAVAAVNSSFFNPTGGGSGYVDGPMVKDGKVITAYSEYNRYNNSMASFSIDKLGKILYNYWKTDMRITVPNGHSLDVTQFNKPSRTQYNDVSVFDKNWGTYSVGASPEAPYIVQVAVEGGKVKRLSFGEPGLEIPKNGYVIVGRASLAVFLSDNNVKPGDKLTFDISTTPDWKNLRMSTTGSAILLENGIIPSPFSFNIAGRNPRTAVGSSKSGRILYIVTVDGRQKGSYGMTQYEMAELMESFGAYNALNLDGGGSTVMVARPLGQSELQIVNSPSEIRNVAADLAITTSAPKSALKRIIISSKDTNVFANTPIKLTVSGYDSFFNPVPVPAGKIKWSVSGVKGRFKDGSFIPATTGTAVITAKVDKIFATVKISSLSKPVEYLIDKNLAASGKPFTLVGKNKDGYYATLDSSVLDLNKAVKLKYIDPAQKKVNYKKVGSNFRFAVLPSDKMSVKDDVYADQVYKLSSVQNSAYMPDSRVISLNASNGGIRATDPALWSWFLKELEGAKEKNIFVLLNGSLDRFSDRLEAKLFQDMLTNTKEKSGKNVWVICRGDSNTSSMERGVKYVTLDGTKCALVTCMDHALTFEFR